MKVIVKHFKQSPLHAKVIQHPYDPYNIKVMDLNEFTLWKLSENDISRINTIPYFNRCINSATVTDGNPNYEYCLIKQHSDKAEKEAMQQIEDYKNWYQKAIIKFKRTEAINTKLKE